MSEQPVRTIPDVDTETEPDKRLNPGEICPQQQKDLTEIAVREIP